MKHLPTLVAAACLAPAAAAVPIDFDVQSDFTDNFFVTNPTVAWDSRGFVRGGTLGDTATTVYDTTPDTAPTNLYDGNYQIDFDLRFTATGGNPFVGVYFKTDGTAARTSPLVLIRERGADDEYFFRSAGDLATASSGATLESGRLGDSVVDATFNHIRLTVDEVNSATQLQVTVEGWATPDATETPIWNRSYTYSVADSANFLGAGEVGFYFNPSNSGANIDIDNFEVTAVPEPSSLALAALGGFALLGRRKLG